LRHSGPADTDVPGERGTILELAGVEQRLVMFGQLQWITAFWQGRKTGSLCAQHVVGMVYLGSVGCEIKQSALFVQVDECRSEGESVLAGRGCELKKA
jgi:hypothetical protein